MNDNSPYQILTDEEFDENVSMDVAIHAIQQAIESHGRGGLDAPSRFSVDAENGSLVFTVGMETDAFNVMGFRVYETIPDSPDDHQLVATYDSDSGVFEGVIIGHRVGATRTGAIGGVAIDLLARSDINTVGILGSGRQARTQLEAAATVRDIEKVNVYSPTTSHREQFATDRSHEFGLDVTAVSSAETAVRGADVLITATASREPVFDPKWLDPGVHINTVGPKFKPAHELAPAVAAKSDVIVTDSLAQVDNYDPEFFLVDTSHRSQMIELSELASGPVPGRTANEEITLFCSVGLAGTEVVLAHEAFRRTESAKE